MLSLRVDTWSVLVIYSEKPKESSDVKTILIIVMYGDSNSIILRVPEQ